MMNSEIRQSLLLPSSYILLFSLNGDYYAHCCPTMLACHDACSQPPGGGEVVLCYNEPCYNDPLALPLSHAISLEPRINAF